MKLNLIPFIIAFSGSLLIGYAFYSFGSRNNLNFHYLMTILGFLFSSLTLSCTFGIDFKSSRTTTNIRTVSGIFFLIGMISLVLMKAFVESIPLVIISSGILGLIYLLIIYSINKSDQ